MRFNYLCLILLFFLFIHFKLRAQQIAIDSLINALEIEKEDTLKINMSLNIAERLAQNGDFTRAMNYARESLFRANEINYYIGIAKAYNAIGHFKREFGNYPEALKNHRNALRVFEKIDNKEGISFTYYYFGNVYLQMEEFESSLINYKKSQDISLEIGDKKLMTNSIMYLGVVMQRMGNYEDALKICFNSLNLNKELNFKQGVSNNYIIIGNLYSEMGKYPEAEKYTKKGLELAMELGNKSAIAASFINLGELNFKKKYYELSENFYSKGLQYAIEIGNKYYMQYSYKGLSKLDSINSNYQGAYNYLKLYYNVKDSILNEETNKQISQIKFEFEFEKKDKEIELLFKENKLRAAEIEKQRMFKYVTFSFSVLIVFMAFLMFLYLKNKHKANKLLESNEIRQRISRDLHDEIGAGLTSISMICEQGKRQVNYENYIFDKISSRSRGISEKLSEVVWATNPENDNLESLISYMRNYVSKFFEETNINYRFDSNDNLKDISFLKPNVSRNLFFILKEALNNIAKHSEANKVGVTFTLFKDKKYKMIIKDNGKGIDFENLPKFRSGFGNMKRRMDEINGTFNINSEFGKGVIVEVEGGFI